MPGEAERQGLEALVGGKHPNAQKSFLFKMLSDALTLLSNAITIGWSWLSGPTPAQGYPGQERRPPEKLTDSGAEKQCLV